MSFLEKNIQVWYNKAKIDCVYLGVNKMKLFYKNKILISGIFPLKNYKIDGYVEKTGIFDDKIINVNDPEQIFYSAGHLINSCYQCVGKDEVNYEFFESENLIEYEVSDELSKDEIQHLFIEEQSQKVGLLQEKIRLLSGLAITLPVFLTTIYRKNHELYTYIGNVDWNITNLKVHDYDDAMKQTLQNRLCFHIADSTIAELKEKNPRYKRALHFYNNSFNSSDVGVRFTLLFSSLEALFNITAENITNEVSKYASRILFLNEKQSNSSKWKIINYYDIRSKYIHGNDGFEITKEIEYNLREYVRKILLIYWNISMAYNITDAQDIKNLLNNIDNDSVDMKVQLFVKYIRTDPDQFGTLYGKIVDNFLNGNFHVLSSEDYKI